MPMHWLIFGFIELVCKFFRIVKIFVLLSVLISQGEQDDFSLN